MSSQKKKSEEKSFRYLIFKTYDFVCRRREESEEEYGEERPAEDAHGRAAQLKDAVQLGGQVGEAHGDDAHDGSDAAGVGHLLGVGDGVEVGELAEEVLPDDGGQRVQPGGQGAGGGK